MGKFWKIKNQTTEKAELQLYGPISNESWWGDEITPKQFSDDLKALGAISSLDVRINSGGGDVFAGVAIYNMLKSHPAQVNVHIDGLAASIASVIAMAGDTINMPAGSMMMIHNPASGIMGYYEAGDLRKIADTLDTIKDSIMDVYAAKCGKNKDEIAAIMDEETWYTAPTAVENGFATDCDDSVSYAARLDKNCLILNGQSFDITAFKHMPKFANAVPKGTVSVVNMQVEKEEESVMTLAELKEKYPDLYKETYNVGVKAERDRVKAINDLAIPGQEELINKALYETGDSVEQVAVQIVKAEKALLGKAAANIAADVVDSKVNGIVQTPPPSEKQTEEQERKAAADMIAAEANKGRVK
ncbi:MAG: head maturation protease, ClpP-related [Veillonellales bacterium]